MNKKNKRKIKKIKKNKYYFYELLKIIFGYSIKFIHYILTTIIITYILIFSKNFLLNIFILSLLIITLYSWYLINCCIVILFENYILNEKKYDMDKRLLTNHTKIKLFETDVIIFDYVKNSSQTYLIFVYLILYLLKIIYLYNIKY
jgi:hypothetical protein